MNWKTFCDINREVIAIPKESKALTFWKLASAVIAVGGVLAAYYGLLDHVVHAFIHQVTPQAYQQASITAWDAASHVWAKALLAIFVLAVVYAFAFFAAAQGYLDYRKQMARSLGLKFLYVKREHDVLDLNGNCRMYSREAFEVYDLYLSHLDRRLQVPSASHRNPPQITVEGLPDGAKHIMTQRDEGNSRTYTLNFVPGLHQSLAPVKFTITELADHAIYMYESETPESLIFESRIESVSQFVKEPIDLLELSVTFPYEYQVGGQTQISVRYGLTKTEHTPEIQRMLREGAVTADTQNGRQTLKLVVREPIVGLVYYLYWQPQKGAKKTA